MGGGRGAGGARASATRAHKSQGSPSRCSLTPLARRATQLPGRLLVCAVDAAPRPSSPHRPTRLSLHGADGCARALLAERGRGPAGRQLVRRRVHGPACAAEFGTVTDRRTRAR